MAQLKGRLGIVTAEAETDLQLVRERAEVLETELSRVLQSIHEAAEPVVRALSAVPSVRDVLSTARLPSPNKGSSSRAKPG